MSSLNIGEIANLLLASYQEGKPAVRTRHEIAVSDDVYWKAGLAIVGVIALGALLYYLIKRKFA